MMEISDANADEDADMLTKLLGVLGGGGVVVGGEEETGGVVVVRGRQTRVSMGSWCFLLVL